MPKQINVKDEYRKNELSLEPGGATLTLVHRSGERRTYDKIKSVPAYVKRAQADPEIIEIWQDDHLVWKR
jgi:hypothetical protein